MRTAYVIAALAAAASFGCRERERAPMEAPVLSADGTLKVPEGYETTFDFDGKPVRLEYTWLEIVDYQGKRALRIHAQGGPRHGTFSMLALVPEATPNLAALKGYPIGAVEDGGVSFAKAPEFATGTGATIVIDDVTPTSVSGHFEAQACAHGARRCDDPKQVTKGVFKAFRSALSDDAAFAR